MCERAGLIAQSIQATSARAVALALAGKDTQAREAAEEAVKLSERLHYPIGRAAALEADGATTEGDPALALLREAREQWASLDRPLDAARCALLAGRARREFDPDGGAAELEDVRLEYERLGVHHQAQRAQDLAAS